MDAENESNARSSVVCDREQSTWARGYYENLSPITFCFEGVPRYRRERCALPWPEGYMDTVQWWWRREMFWILNAATERRLPPKFDVIVIISREIL
jgi:hypothetical protein